MLADNEGFAFDGDDDARFLSDLIVNGTTELIKTRDSAFLYTDLEERLTAWNIQQLVLCGVFTHGCIAATAADAYARNIDVALAQDAIGSHLPEAHDCVLALLSREYRQRIISSENLSFSG